STPPMKTSAPADAAPAARADSSIGPDSRVSRRIRNWGRSAPLSIAAALPRRVASSAVRKVPAGPRTPSVPKNLRSATAELLALRELRLLAGLLEAGLAPLLDPRVASEEAPL